MKLASVDFPSLGFLLAEKIKIYLFTLLIGRHGHASNGEGQKSQMEGTENLEIRNRRCVG